MHAALALVESTREMQRFIHHLIQWSSENIIATAEDWKTYLHNVFTFSELDEDDVPLLVLGGVASEHVAAGVADAADGVTVASDAAATDDKTGDADVPDGQKAVLPQTTLHKLESYWWGQHLKESGGGNTFLKPSTKLLQAVKLTYLEHA